MEPDESTVKNPTIGDNFLTSALLITQTKKETHLSESTLIKLLELQMLWAMNNRSSVADQIFDPREMDGGGGEPVDLPAPDEIITASEEPA